MEIKNQETQTKLEAATIRKLFELPAFRLEGKKIEVFNTYLVNYIVNNISKNKTNTKTNLSNFRGVRKKIKVTLSMLTMKAWLGLLLSVFFNIVSYFAVRQNHILIQLIGLGLLFAFICAFWLFIIESQSIYTLVESTFNYLDKISKDVQIKVDNIYRINRKKSRNYRRKY